MLTESQITALECCLLEKVDTMNVYSYQGRLSQDRLNETALLNYQIEFIRNYIPNGTLLEEGFISSAILDMSTITTFGVLVGAVIVNGVVIGVIPEDTYADLQAVITAVVDAINNGSFGYTATDNGDNTITLNAPGPGTEANGFAVTIQINPTFGLQKSITDTPKGWNQIIYIDNPASSFDGYTVSVSAANTGISPGLTYNVVGFTGNATTTANFVTVSLPANIGGTCCSYDPINDQIYVGGFVNSRRIAVIKPGFAYNAADDIVIPFVPTNPSPTATLGFNRAYYNPFDECTYFTMPNNNTAFYQYRTIFKLANDGTQTHLIVAVGYQTSDMRVNPANGRMWIIPSSTSVIRNVRIIDGNGTTITTIAPVNYAPTAIEYYEGDGTVGSERMFIAFDPIFPAVDFRIATYLLDGTLDNATFYTSLSTIINIHYSSLWNTIFISNGSSDVVVLRMDGTLKQTLVGLGSGTSGFVDDPNYNYTIGTETVFIVPREGIFNFFTLGDDGSEEADGALEGGTPDVFQTEADQCVEEIYVNNLIEHLKAECGCEDCNETPTNGSVVPPPVTPTFLVYYGRSALTTLTNTQVEALTSVTSVTYAGTYLYEAVIPSSYCYFAYPASQGTPSRIYDASTGFDVAVEAVFQVTINSIIYNVYRTYFELGGEIQITFAS